MALVKLEKMKTTVHVHPGVDLMFWKTRKCKQGAREPFGVVLAVAGYDRRAYFAEELERAEALEELEEKLGDLLGAPSVPEPAAPAPPIGGLKESRQELDRCALCGGEPGKAPAVVELEHVDAPICADCQEEQRSATGRWPSDVWRKLEEAQRAALKREEESST